MEFYLHNKDDRKLKTLVNLATTFKIDDDNYIIYYNTEVEKTVIDIYIGKISYGDECLVINKIPSDKQNNFLSVVKEVLANKEPETEFSDYKNIIDTAIIVLESVQKIQIPTTSLELLKKYHNLEVSFENSVELDNHEEIVEKNLEADNVSEKNENNDVISFELDSSFNNENKELQNDEKQIENNDQPTDNKEESKIEENTNDNFINSNDMLSGLDNLLTEREVKKKEKNKKEKKINTPLLIVLILVLIITGILYFVGSGIE